MKRVSLFLALVSISSVALLGLANRGREDYP